jgi:subtilisin family serine protease
MRHAFKPLTRSTKVCVIDTGINYNHPDLVDNMPDQLVWDAINNQPAGPDNDGDGHGTHIAGASFKHLVRNKCCLQLFYVRE